MGGGWWGVGVGGDPSLWLCCGKVDVCIGQMCV